MKLSEQESDQWLRDLAALTKSLSCPLDAPLDEPTLTAVESTLTHLHRFVQQGTNPDLKRKVEAGVRSALKSICALKPAIESTPQEALPMIVRVLDLGESLLECHKLIVHQLIQSSVGRG